MDDSNDKNLSEQANHVWSMLNDMSATDPAAYRKFIDKHVKEGREYMMPPQPHMCVSTSTLDGDKKIALYINICEWNRIPAPKTDQDPIPITGSSIYNLPDNKDGDLAIAIAFNPKVLEECGRNAAMKEEQGLLIGLCLDFIERQHAVNVARSYSVLPNRIVFKGPRDAITQGLMAKTKKADEEFDSELSELEKKFGFGLKDSILNLSNEQDKSSRQKNVPKGDQKLKTDVKTPINILPSEPKPAKPGLIREINTSPDGDSSSLPQPEFELKFKDGDEKGRRYILRVNLPSLSSVQDCELDISPDDVKLLVPSKCQLVHKFKEKINDEKASAKFNKKSGYLTLTLPIRSMSS